MSVWVWPFLSGVVTSFLVVYLLYRLQRPNLKLTVSDDKYNEAFDAHYVHLNVQNISKPFLGGGTATNCSAKIVLDDGRTFVPKWASRPNPLRTEFYKEGSNLNPIQIVEPMLIEQAKYEYLRPRDQRPLDVAVRFKGESYCYIHEPENFTDPKYRPEKNRLRTGYFRFECVLDYEGGHSSEFRFRLNNPEGESPGLLTLEALPEVGYSNSLKRKFQRNFFLIPAAIATTIALELLTYANVVYWYYITSFIWTFTLADVGRKFLIKWVKRGKKVNRTLAFLFYAVAISFLGAAAALLGAGIEIALGERTLATYLVLLILTPVLLILGFKTSEKEWFGIEERIQEPAKSSSDKKS